MTIVKEALDEPGLDPGRELSALRQRILNGDPTLTTGTTGTPELFAGR
ncbi:hypothetical protein [Streptomyces sp. NBC_00203]